MKSTQRRIDAIPGERMVSASTVPDRRAGARRRMAELMLSLTFLAFSRPALAVEVLYSIDIGSDAAMSDPFADGDEGYDPGDVYDRAGPLVTLPGGSDGTHLDDVTLFGFDPHPDPLDIFYVTVVPVGGGCSPPGPPVCYNGFFDLDGYDVINVSLRQELGIQPDQALDVPIQEWQFALEAWKECLHDAKFLTISYDDDVSRSWSLVGGPLVPVDSPSPIGNTYGTTAGQDELVGITIGPGGGVSRFPIADEVTVRADLAPNPAGGEADDDDVDALDIRSSEACDVFLYSADHEGRNGLNPGAIYQRGVAGAVLLPQVHLGIAAESDIDAFEMAWLPYEGGRALAILFSVDDDDPRTLGADESGGLNPAAIYASFMNGAFFVYVAAPAEGADDIDALAISESELELESCPIFADVNCDGTVNFADLLAVLSAWGPCSGCPEDVNDDGSVDFGDLLAVLSNWNAA